MCKTCTCTSFCVYSSEALRVQIKVGKNEERKGRMREYTNYKWNWDDTKVRQGKRDEMLKTRR